MSRILTKAPAVQNDGRKKKSMEEIFDQYERGQQINSGAMEQGNISSKITSKYDLNSILLNGLLHIKHWHVTVGKTVIVHNVGCSWLRFVQFYYGYYGLNLLATCTTLHWNFELSFFRKRQPTRARVWCCVHAICFGWHWCGSTESRYQFYLCALVN